MNYAARWLVVDRDVYEALRKIPKRDADRILAGITEMATNPYSGDVFKMRGERDVWRRRIGSYRLFYEVLSETNFVHIYAVERRTSTTY